MNYFTGFAIICWLALIILSILVFENNRIKNNEKRILYFTYAIVAVACAAEWVGLLINGNPDIPDWLLKLVKFFDYVLTPVAGGIIVLQLRKVTKIIDYIIFGVLAVNFIFQFISLFTDWMIVISDHIYKHGHLYIAYVVMYFIVLLLVIVKFALYGRRFKRQNVISLYSVLTFLIAGVVIQIIFNIRIAYVAITIGLALLFIRYVEFSQLLADDKINEQRILITVDPLTGILNRYAYEKALSRINEIKEDFVVFSIDINGLKRTNDSFGHQAGDELICGAAQVISEVFNKYGECYRTGGDEFIALSHVSYEEIDNVLKELEEKTSKWRGEEVKELSLSAGQASKKEFPDYTVDDLVGKADQRMYKNKADYYQVTGHDRRKN